MSKFKIFRLMAVIFTPEFSIGNILKLANKIQDLTGERFDGELMSVPLPQNAPPEIPRFVLNSKDGTWKLEVSLSRTNISFIKPLNLDLEVPDMESFSNFAENFFVAYKNERELKVQRMGFVTERFSIPEMPPSDFLAKKFFKKSIAEGVFKDLNTLELNSSRRSNLESFAINSLVKIRTARLTDESETPIIVVISDINTQADSDVDFDERAIQNFFEIVPNHTNIILKDLI